MKLVGIAFIIIGILVFLVVFVASFQNQKQSLSPIPQDNSIKVIIVTPSSE